MRLRPLIPNLYSSHKTPASVLIDAHYARLGVFSRWDWDRFTRMAAFLNYTPYELSSVIGMAHQNCTRSKRLNSFPGEACVNLTLLEAQAMKGFSTDIITNLYQYDQSQGA